eukprot:CAMPEP_0204343752 /NCGR_PEP_ID=MMETSP0469-20131031/25121_1 /ASSEMBLY_ACC=CAM_ASM_000384 /TAXON_ID=2969 /ORGANISM="Oxyrrhis marina" /LENGTH=240 /DNA_ID=CAMNT_0051328899 /DNA_START=40 /DNA_END=762 /DNA_ORIENTATION=-
MADARPAMEVVPHSDFVVQGISITTAVAMAIGVLVTGLGGTGSGNVFSYHIAFMSLAWVGCGFCGFWSYLSPEGTGTGAKEDRRQRHMMCMLGATALSVLGYIAIFKAHSDNGEGHLGGLQLGGDGAAVKRSWARFIHVVLGYLVLTGCAVQAVMGMSKKKVLEATGEKTVTWHGQLGRVVLQVALVAVLFGIWIQWNAKGGWALWAKILFSAVVAGALILLQLPSTPAPMLIPVKTTGV